MERIEQPIKELDYLNLIDTYKDEMIKSLQELIQIPSVVKDGNEKAPFGEEVDKAFSYMLKKAENDGFDVENIDNYGGHIEFGGYLLDEDGDIVGTSDEALGILVHLDVVPAGSGWDSDPFSGEVIDGRIYGRGSTDDKGPTIAAYYAMKALKEAGVITKKKVRMILGLDEETNWVGVKKYFQKVKEPEFSFTPDSDFPIIHGEKGIVVFEIAKKIGKSTAKGLELRTFTGGNAPNMVADSARVVLRGNNYDEVRKKLDAFKKETGYKLKAKGMGKSLEITAEGISSHGARPEKGLNAISVMMKFIETLGIANEDMCEFIDFYNKNISFELDGKSLGCGFRDEASGNLICNVGLINIDSEAAILTVNIRYPVNVSDVQLYTALEPVMNKYNMGIVKLNHKEPIYIPADDPKIKLLMDIYQRQTGDYESKPLVIGGGTYARAVKNGIAFGATFPGEPELAHQKNEFIEINSLIKSAKIYAEAICKLAEGERPPAKVEELELLEIR